MTEQSALNQISAEDYAMWRHHPVSKIVIQYITDFAAVLEREALDRWRSGSLRFTDEQEMRGRVLTCKELAELPFEAIKAFYEGEKEA